MTTMKAKSRHAESEFKLIYFTAFAVFLVGMLVGKLIPTRWSWNASRHHEGKSIFAAARAAACRTIPFAFM